MLLPKAYTKVNLFFIREILSDQGFIGLWKGNIASTLRILAQLSSRIILYDRIKYYFNKKKRVHTQTKFNIPVDD